MSRLHIRVSHRHRDQPPAFWVFLTLLGLFVLALSAIAGTLHTLVSAALDIARLVLTV